MGQEVVRNYEHNNKSGKMSAVQKENQHISENDLVEDDDGESLVSLCVCVGGGECGGG